MPLVESERVLVSRIRAGEEDAWTELIARFEGRLLAFVDGRLGRRSAAEDVVQETFMGLLNSLPNFDESRSLESYLFSIAAHKLTDLLRREGRRPTLPLAGSRSSSGEGNVADKRRAVSSMMRSDERRGLEKQALVEALRDQLAHLRARGDWQKLKCVELLLVRGWANKDVARYLDISEQVVANYKFDFLARLRTLVRRQGLPEEVFPELYAKD